MYGRSALSGAAIGGVTGAGLSYAAHRKAKTKDDKSRRFGAVVRGAMGGAATGAWAGLHLAAHNDTRHYTHYGYGRRRRYGGFGGHRAKPDHRPHMKMFDLTGNEKTKAEAKKKFYNAAMKFHPDRPGGSHAKMQEVNEAWESIKNSTWFDKLAGENFTTGFSRTARIISCL